MALKNQALYVVYKAWNTSTNAGQTGDVLNHTLKLDQDGASNPPTNSPAEIDSTNRPGDYRILLAAGDMNFNSVSLGGKSSTANVVIFGVNIVTERGVLPTAAPGNAGGILEYGTGTGQLNPIGGAVNLAYPDSSVMHSGTAQAGAAGSITLASGASATNNLYNGSLVRILSGTGAGQTRVILSYNGATKVATTDWAWTTNPDATSVYAVAGYDLPDLDSSLRVTVGTNSDKTGYSLTQSFPANFASLSISVGGKVAATMGSADYTGNTVQTGDSFARIGSAGSGLTSLAPAATALSTAAWTAARAGYLDNLNAGGVVASHADTAALSTQIGAPLQAGALSAPRALDAIADGSITVNDALWCAVAASAGKEDASSGTSLVVQTPSTGTTLRTFTLTAVAGTPTSYITKRS